jgi:pimeloyl-ACP methyl ester carboxylesterase
MSNIPTLVLVHGSWHQPNCYNPITRILKEKYVLKSLTVALPSTTGNPSAGLKDDIDATQEAISSEVSQGNDVVIIAHSYGGLVGSSAIKGFESPPVSNHAVASDSTTPRKGHVIGLILIATGFALTGVAFMDPFFGHPPPQWRVNEETGYADLVVNPRDFFYHDIPEQEAQYWVSQLRTQSLKALFEGGEFAYAGWLDVPTWYIGTIKDRGLPVAVQRISVGMAREMGGSVVHREMRTSHSPFLSRPEETARIILEAVEDFSGGKVVADEAVGSGKDNEIVVPAVRLWSLSTWYKFGLPLGFGHVIGRCIIVIRSIKRLLRK